MSGTTNGSAASTTADSQLQVVLSTLLEYMGDKSLLVSETVNQSVRKVAEKNPNQVLQSCCRFCTDKKPNYEHYASVLQIMEVICVDHIIEIDGDTIMLIIDFCLKTMVDIPNYEPVVQLPACNVLVALGRKHHIQVMDGLLKHLQTGAIPHYMIPHTVGSLANANPFGVVPYVKNIWGIMLPLVGAVKPDSLKQAFCYAFESFCEALLEYTANLDQVPDNTIKIENFQLEIDMSFDTLFTKWLQSREPKVTESVLNALSEIFLIMSVDNVSLYTARIVSTLLNLYRRQQVDPFCITKCLKSVIQKAASVNGTLLEPLLSNILQTLFELVCVSPDYVQPNLLRNHAEVLRCYECIALHFTDSSVDQLIAQLRNSNEREKVKALLVITHLTSYSTEHAIQRRFKDIMKYLSDMLNDPNIKVKKALMKIIVAFATKGVLLQTDVNPDGPDRYIEFIIKLCCKQFVAKNSEAEYQNFLEVQKSANNTLCMLSTSVHELESTLWNLVMRCFLEPAYDDAVVVLLRCLTHLASRRNTVELASRPKGTEVCEAAFTRCLTLMAVPLPDFRGTFLLNFLRNIKPYNTDRHKAVWESKLPQLLKYLEQNYDNFHQSEWQDLVLNFLGILLEAVADQKFNEVLIANARKQLDVYNRFINGNPDPVLKQSEKQFLLKCLAIILCHVRDKLSVLQTLDYIFSVISLTDYSELNTCATVLGIASRVHLEVVLDKLHTIRNEVLVKKSTKFLSFPFMKDQKRDLATERMRYVVICSYSEICDEASSDKLLKVVESEILDFVVGELIACKDFSIRKVCLNAIGSVANAMHPNRNTLHIRMTDRDNVLQLVSSQIHLHSGPEYIELFPIILPVMTSIVKLPLPLESEQRLKLLKICFDNVYNSSAIYCKISTDNTNGNDSYYGDLKLVPFVTSSFTKLNQLVQELLLQTLSPATLDEIVTLLEPWLNRKKAEQRLPAVETLRTVLQTYLDNMKFAYDAPSTFGQTGFLLARIVPRTTDPNKNIRKVAIESLCLVLYIASRYEGHMRDHDKQLSNSMQHIQQQIELDEPKLLYNLTVDLAHIICANLPSFQLSHYVDSLIDALLDCETSSSSGASVVLSTTIKNKGAELQNQVAYVLERILVQLDKVKCPRTKNYTLHSILNLATHNSKTVCQMLLNQPIPFDGLICDCWAVLSTDSTLVLDLIDQLKKAIKQTPLYEEQGQDIKVASVKPLQAVCALHEMLKNQQLKEVCKSNFPELFSILLVTLSSYIGTTSPVIRHGGGDTKKEKYGFVMNREAYKLKPAKVALDTLRLFLTCSDHPQTAGCLLQLTQIDCKEDYSIFLDTISCLVENVCVENPESLSWLVACLGPYIRAELEPQRVVVVAFFASLLKQKPNKQVLAENLLEMILDVQMDQSCTVRKIALQGLGFAAEHLELVSRHCQSLLGVLMNSLDYNNIGNESDVILEGMLSFSKLLTTLEGHKLSNCQVTAAVRIKPLLDQEDFNLRRASFHLLGDLTLSMGSDTNNEAFREQVQGDFVTLILHLCDPDMYVVKACKYTLRKVGPYLDSPKVNSMLQEHLIDEANLHYEDFIKDLIKVMADEMQDLLQIFIMTSLSYLKSPWMDIRSNAALLVGLMFFQLNAENKQRISLDTVCDKLMRLLNDECEIVRMRATQAIAYLFVN